MAAKENKQRGLWDFIPGAQPPKKKSDNETRKEYEQSKRARKYLRTWEEDRPWLHYDEEREVMFCSVCREFSKLVKPSSGSISLKRPVTSSFVIGNQNFRISSILDHERSQLHSSCLEVDSARKAKKSESVAHKTITCLNKAAIEKLRILFRTCHSLAMHARPYTDYEWMSNLDEAKGVKVGEMYRTRKSCKDFTYYIAEAIREENRKLFEETKFVSIIVDGSTDASVAEQEILYIRFSLHGEVYVKFIGIQSVDKADAAGILDAVTKCMMSYLNCDRTTWYEKIVCAATDGASVMVGKNNGFVAKMKHMNPCIQGFHCLAHRLELVFKHAMKKIELFSKAETMFKELNNFYHNSALNRSGLKISFRALNLLCVLPTRFTGSRWLQHSLKAMEHFLQGFEAIVAHLDSVVQFGNVANTKARASGILKLMKNKNVLQFVGVLYDIVSSLAALSLQLQDSTASLWEVHQQVIATKHFLEKMKTIDGPKTRNAKKIDSTFKGVKLNVNNGKFSLNDCKEKLLAEVIPEIDKMFSDTELKFLDATKIMELHWLQEHIDSNREEIYQHIITLIDIFNPVLLKANVEVHLIEMEFEHLIQYIRDCEALSLTWTKLNKCPGSSKFKNFLSLVDLLLSFPVSSSDCERGFSCMKKVKSDWRASLNCNSLSDLLAIQLSGIDEKTFNPEPAIALWTSGKSRRIMNSEDNLEVLSCHSSDMDDDTE